jgi:hypothetical protein
MGQGIIQLSAEFIEEFTSHLDGQLTAGMLAIALNLPPETKAISLIPIVDIFAHPVDALLFIESPLIPTSDIPAKLFLIYKTDRSNEFENTFRLVAIRLNHISGPDLLAKANS